MSAKVDLREWQAAVREVLSVTKKGITETLNTQSFYVTRGAGRDTRKADRSKIEALGVVGYKLSKSKTTGTIKRGKAIIGKNSAAANIVAARMKKANVEIKSRDQIEKAARSLIGKRLKAIGTQAAGWLGMIRTFGKAIGQPSSGGKNVKGKGHAKPARDGWSPSAEFTYNLNSFTTKHKQYIDPDTVRVLQQNFDAETRKTREYLQKKLQPAFNKHSGK